MKFSMQDINRIVDANKEVAIDFFQKVIQIPSVTGDERAVGAFIKQWLEENTGLEVKNYEREEGHPNLIVNWKGKKPGKRFLFNGHMDVFPPVESDMGTYGPWSGTIADGYLYGRGTADMKGGLCATIMAVYYLKKLGYEPETGTVTLSCCSDEEDGGKNGVLYLLEEGELKADYGVCAEPTHHRLLVTGSGGIWAKIVYRAETLHGSLPQTQLDAIQKAYKAQQALYEYGERIQKERYYEPFGLGPICSVTMIEGGETSNMHPSCCTITIDRRLVPTETIAGVEQEIKDLLEGLKQDDPSMEFEYTKLEYTPQYRIDKDHKLIQSGLEAYEAVMGKKTCTFERSGGSDAHIIVERYPDCCLPNYGPALEEECCLPDEKLKLDDYIAFIKIYMKMVMDMQG